MIAIDVERDLAVITVGGFFKPEDVEALRRAREMAFARLRCPPNQHRTLVDMRGMEIQPQEIVRGFAAMLAEPRWRSRALAFVVSRTLARSQIARAANGRDAAFFEEEDDARAWLLDGASACLPQLRR